MPRPIAAHVHVDALAHNLRRAREAGPGARVWAVVKANAYGHGIARVYEGLKGADGFALLDVAEAEQIRGLGWRGPILLLEGCFDARDLEACSRLGLWHTVHHEAQIDLLAGHKTHLAHQVYLKLNSGMNRLGFRPDAFRTAWLRLTGLTQVESITLMTHFSDADAVAQASSQAGDDASDQDTGAVAQGSHADTDAARPDRTHGQLAVFEAAIDGLSGDRSLCNSAALLRHGSDPRLRGDWTRPGIMLYGSAPDHPGHDVGHWGLQPTMSLRAALIAIQDVGAGESVGYGSVFTADRPMRVGVVACGYADGYPRLAPTGTPVLVDGVRTALVGRVSMDMITVDLGPVPAARLGSEATLWGASSSGVVLPIDDVARSAGTLGYELMCALAPRVPTRTA